MIRLIVRFLHQAAPIAQGMAAATPLFIYMTRNIPEFMEAIWSRIRYRWKPIKRVVYVDKKGRRIVLIENGRLNAR